MKSLFISLALIFLLAGSANCQNIEGTYTNKWEAKSGESISYNLTLKEDGTFKFQSTRTFLASTTDNTLAAEGIWKLDGRLLILQTNEKNNELSSKLNMNKARYMTVSPRNPQFNLAKHSFKFYESDVFYAKDMELIKTDVNLTSSH